MTRTTKLITAGAIALVVAGGGVTYAVASDDGDGRLTGSDLEQASTAAVAAAGGGTVTDAERDGDRYEIEVRREDGTEVDIDLDRAFTVIRVDEDDRHDDRDDAEGRDGRDTPDADDRALTDDERQQASDAALAATGAGEVVEVEADDAGYDVEVRLADGTQIDVDLDATFTVLHTEADD